MLTVLALAGCASLPSGGPVQRGVEGAPAPDGIVLLAEDPKPGDSPVDVVRGFLSGSAAGLADDFTVARKYLTEAAGSVWRPSGGVIIYSGTIPLVVEEREAGVVDVTATVAGSVDARGVYIAALPGTTTTSEYHLVQDAADQWRIGDLEDGVLMSEVIFGAQYRQTALYFLSPDGEALVPDTRWYPQRNSATSALQGLFGGAVEWLAPGVISAIPPGTALSFDAVTVSGGVAQVDVTEEILQAGAADRLLLRTQIEQTLTQLPQLRQVVISVDGVTLSSPGRVPELVVDPTVGRSPTVLTDGELMAFNGSALVPAAGAVLLEELQPSHPAMPYHDGPAVILSGANTLVTVPTATDTSSVVAQGVGLVPPSYDRYGWVWTANAANSGALIAGAVD
ncbi:MAG: GerMN domain-containing protein, partial [Actinomycetales bacterium]|nr:GerMN domain-containing protein [Actinomycetales bacterium]